jgi:hypothetical protein
MQMSPGLSPLCLSNKHADLCAAATVRRIFADRGGPFPQWKYQLIICSLCYSGECALE